MPFMTKKDVDYLETQRGSMTPEQVQGLDRIKSRNENAVQPDFMENLHRFQVSGRYDPEQHRRPLIRDFLENGLGVDFSTTLSLEQGVRDVFGHDDLEQVEQFIFDASKEVQQIDPYLSMDEEEQSEEARQRIRTDQIQKPETGLRGLIQAIQTDRDMEKNVPATRKKLEGEAVQKSSKLMYRWAASRLSPSEERIAWRISAADDAAGVAKLHREEILAMPPDKQGAMWAMVGSLNTTIDAGMAERLGLAVINPAKDMFHGVGNWAKGQGVKLVTDHPSEWSDQVNREFSEKERSNLWNEDGTLNPKYSKRMGTAVDSFLGIGKYRVAPPSRFGLDDIPAKDWPKQIKDVQNREREHDKASHASFLEKASTFYNEGTTIREVEVVQRKVRKAMYPKYESLGAAKEGLLNVTEGAVYMAELAGVSMIPVVGGAAAGFLMYAPQQAEWEDALIYDHNVEPQAAVLLSSTFAGAYAAVENLQVGHIKDLGLEKFIGPRGKEMVGFYLKQYFKTGIKTTGNETLEEWIQTGIGEAMFKACEDWAHAENIDWDARRRAAWRDIAYTTAIMPGITFMGGGMVRGGAGVKMATVDGMGVKGLVRSMVPGEIAQMREDMRARPAAWKAEQKVRKMVKTFDEKALINKTDVRYYAAHHDEEGFDEWMEEKGYDPATDRERFETSLEFYQTLVERESVELEDLNARLAEVEERPDDVPLPLDGDPFWGVVDSAMEELAPLLNVQLEKFDTQEEAHAAYPDVPMDRLTHGAAFVGEGKAILIKENLTSPVDAYQKMKHEVVSHLGLAQENVDGPAFIARMRDTLGDELINAMLPEYAGLINGTDEERASLRAEEVISKFIERLSVARINKKLDGGSLRQKLGNWLDDALGVKGTGELTAESIMELTRELFNAVTKGQDFQPLEEKVPEVGKTVEHPLVTNWAGLKKLKKADLQKVAGDLGLDTKGKNIEIRDRIAEKTGYENDVLRERFAKAGAPVEGGTPVRVWYRGQIIQIESSADGIITGRIKGVNNGNGKDTSVLINPDSPAGDTVFIVNRAAADGTTSEEQVLLGFDTEAEAKAAYIEHAGKREEGKDSIDSLPWNEFEELAGYVDNYAAHLAEKKDMGDRPRFSVADSLRRYDAVDVVEISGEEMDVPHTDYAASVAWAEENGQTGEFTNAETGWEIIVSKKRLKGALHKGAARDKVQMLAGIQSMIERAVFLESDPDYKPKTLSHFFAVPVRVAGKEYAVGFVIHEDIQTHKRYYTHELVEEKDLKGAVSEYGSKPEAPRGHVKRVLQKHLGVNPDETARFSMKSASDNSEFVPRILAGHLMQGREVDGKMAKQILRAMKAEIPENSELEWMIEEAKMIMSESNSKAETIINDRDLARVINSTAERRILQRRIEEVKSRYFKDGAEWQKVQNDMVEGERRRSDILKRLSTGLSDEELREVLGFELSELVEQLGEFPDVEIEEASEESKPDEEEQTSDEDAAVEEDEYIGAGNSEQAEGEESELEKSAPEEILNRIAQAVVDKFHAAGELKTNDLKQGLRKPWVLAEYQKSLRTVLRRFAREFTSKNRAVILVESADKLVHYQTLKGTNNRAMKVLRNAKDQRINQTQEELVSKAWKLTDKFKGRMKYTAEETKRAVAAKAHLYYKAVREVMTLSEEKVEEEIEAIMTALSEEKPPKNTEDIERWKQESLIRLDALMSFGAIKHKTLAETATAVEFLEDDMEKQFAKQEAARLEIEKEADRIRQNLRAVSPNRRKGAKGDGWFKDSNSKLQFLEFRLEQLAFPGSGAAHTEALRDMKDIAFDIARSGARKEAAIFQHNQAFSDALLAIYDKTLKNKNVKWEAKGQVDRYQAGKLLRELTRGREEYERFSTKGRALSKANLLQIIGMLAQEDYRKVAQMQLELEERVLNAKGTAQDIARNLWQTDDEFAPVKWTSTHGYELNGPRLERLVVSIQKGSLLGRRLEMEPDMLDALTTEDLQVLEWMRQSYRDNRAELSAMNEKITGLPFPEADENYIPGQVDFQRVSLGGVTIKMPVTPASLTPRVFNTRDLDEEGSLVGLYMQRLQSNQQFLHFAPIYQNVARIFNNPELRTALENTHGKEFVEQLITHLRDVITGTPISSKRVKGADAVVNFMATTKLGFNISLAPRQVTSLPAFAMYVPAKDFAKAMGGLLTKESWATMREMLKHDYVKTRLGRGNTQVLTEMLSSLEEKRLSLWDAYKHLGTIPTRYGDIIPTLLFGSGYINILTQQAAERGMKAEEGREWAFDRLWGIVEMSQQSAQMHNLSEYQRHGGSFARWFYQFHSTQMQFYGRSVHDTRAMLAAIHNEDGGLKNERVQSMVKQFGKNSVINFLVLGSLYHLVAMGWNAILGDEPDEDDWKRFTMNTLTSPLGGMLLMGTAITLIIDGAVTGDRGYGESIVSASSVFDDVKTLGAFLNHLATGDPEQMLKDGDRILKSLNPIYRDVSKVWKNYSE